MTSKTFNCNRCGQPHVVEADYFLPGISGYVAQEGKQITFVDPTEPSYCASCTQEMLEDLRKRSALKNAENCISENKR